MKKFIGKIIRILVSQKAYRTSRLGFKIIPNYYKNHIDDLEKFIDIKNETQNDETAALLSLRKQAHMLDKGLQRSDFEPGHSKSVHQNATYYLNRLNENYSNDPSVIWSKEKIEEYEKRQNSPDIKNRKSHEGYKSLNETKALGDLIKSRRSVRNFKPDKVDLDILEECIETINWGPSSCNKQPIYVFLTNNPHKAFRCALNAKGYTGFSEVLPCFISVCVDMRSYLLPSEMYLPGIDASLGTQNMLLMMASKGLSSTVLSWAQKDHKEEQGLRKELEIPDYCNIIFNIAVGYPEEIPPTPQRKSLTNTLRISNNE